MNPKEKCGGCKYFVRILVTAKRAVAGKQDKNAGECHRHAPRPSLRPKMQIEGKDLWADIQWPNVGANAWCGEFEKK